MFKNYGDVKKMAMLMPELSAAIATLGKVSLFVINGKSFKYLYENLENEWKKSE
jgi:hypothetical protein